LAAIQHILPGRLEVLGVPWVCHIAGMGGVIHQEGGAQIAVLPVHSQNRGRLFLPFVDEDPKTAEILTKIIFFAEDDKIKDPSILNQIK